MATGVAVVGASGAIEVDDILGLPVRVADRPFLDDEDYDRRPQRRRYEESLVAQVRRQLLTIAESVRVLLASRASCASVFGREHWICILIVVGDCLGCAKSGR